MTRTGLTSAAKGELVFTSFLFLAGVVVLTDTDVGGLREEHFVGVALLDTRCVEVARLSHHFAVFIASRYTRD